MPINYPSESLENKFISSSFQDLLQIYGTLVLDGTGSLIFDSSQLVFQGQTFAGTASIAPTSWSLVSNIPTGLISGSSQVNYNQLANLPTGIVSSSTQINTGSFTGSFVGTGVGLSGVVSSSYAFSASWAPANPNAVSSSYALTASYAPGSTLPSTIAYTDVSNLFIRPQTITGSVNVMSGSIVLGVTGAGVISTSDQNIPILITIGDGTDSGAYRSYFFQNNFNPRYCGGVLARKARGTALSPQAIQSGDALAGYQAMGYNGTTWTSNVGALRIDAAENFTTASNGTDMLVQVTARGQLLKRNTVIFGADGEVLLNNAITVPSASNASGALLYAVDGNLYFIGSGTYGTGATFIAPKVSASNFYGDGTNVTGIVTSSYSITASYAANASAADFNTLANKPTLVSSSIQVNTGSFTGSFIGDGTLLTASYADMFTISGTLNVGQSSSLTGLIINRYLTPTTAPTTFEATQRRLVIYGSGSGPDATSIRMVTIGSAPAFIGYRANGSSASPTASITNDILLQIGGGGYGTGWEVSARSLVRFIAAENWNATSKGTKVDIQTTQTGSTTTRTVAVFNHDGTFILGTDPGGSQMLRVSRSAYFGELVTFGGAATGTFSGTFNGDGTFVTNVISSSYALSASWSPPVGTFDPTIVRGYSGSLTGSVTGNLQGSSSFATTASAATSITFVPISASFAGTSWNVINNIPVGLVSSSIQVNTGSFTGSFTGSLLGSASYATTASAATSITFTPTTASYSTTASYALTNAGTVNSANTASVAFSVSGSGTGSFTGSFTGSLLGSASFATTASAATSITFVPVSASYAGTSWNAINNIPVGLISSSLQFSTGSYTGSFTGSLLGSSSYAGTDWLAINNKPIGLVSSSLQFGTGSYTGSFTGSLLGSASFATTASYALTSAGSVINAQTASVAFSVSGSGTGSFTGSFTGSTTNAVSASFATTASAATSITFLPASASFAGTSWNVINNIPIGLVSSSIQVSTGSYTGSFTGSLLGSASYSTTSSAATSITFVPVSASFAGTAWNVINNIPVGLVSSSLQFGTGSYTGSFTGSLLGSASFATTASAATSITFLPASASFAGTDWIVINNKPIGLVSSSIQINTGSFTGSFTGSLLGSASFATTASAATSITFLPSSASYAGTSWNAINNIPVGLISASAQYNTGSYTGSFTGSATNAVSASFVSGAYTSQWALTSSFAVTASAATSITFTPSTASYAITASYANSGRASVIMLYNGAFGGNTLMTNISGTIVEWNVSQRTLSDLTGYTTYKTAVEIISGTIGGTNLGPQFSTDQVSWSFFGSASGVQMSVTGVATSSYTSIPINARADNIYLRWVTWSGSANTAARIGTINLWVK